jgi:serine/threonine-protein kinase
MSGTVSLPERIRLGLVLADKYRLEEEIGRGSMGTVYRAVHVSLGQRVAIKLISTEHSQLAEARARFSIEAKAAAKLRSRHVVQVIDDGETPEGIPYIVLEYLEGETLEQRLLREGDLALPEAIRVVTHVGRALARAHAEGIVHRDLKPANIFLVKGEEGDAWTAKVLDFGIAKLQEGEKGTTRAGTVLGTPLFMSPEQVRGASSVDHRADLYSLGMCLFHMLTGEYAYYSENYSETLVAICTLPLPKLREKAPWAPEAVERWFERACAKEPLERFQSADEMTEALQATGGAAPLSKHQSVPEGRIAPETLLGFAAPPALGTVPADAAQLGLARTEALSGRPSPVIGRSTVPLGVSLPAEPRAASAPRIITGDDWAPPPRPRFLPWVLGAVLGLSALAILGVAFRLLEQEKEPEPTRIPTVVQPSVVAAAPTTATTAPVLAAPSSAPATDPGSSVAAGTAPSSVPLSAPGGSKKTEKKGSPPSPPRPAPSPVERPSSSDLGF